MRKFITINITCIIEDLQLGLLTKNFKEIDDAKSIVITNKNIRSNGNKMFCSWIFMSNLTN